MNSSGSLSTSFSSIKKKSLFFTTIVSEAAHEISQPDIPAQRICRDLDDDYILACAMEADADYLVTGGSDLRVLISHEKTKIISPREFEILFEDLNRNSERNRKWRCFRSKL
jgi:hypothetical protein